jgi:hypothetical protein
MTFEGRRTIDSEKFPCLSFPLPGEEKGEFMIKRRKGGRERKKLT